MLLLRHVSPTSIIAASIIDLKVVNQQIQHLEKLKGSKPKDSARTLKFENVPLTMIPRSKGR